jgi:uncharacterized protein (TIRG00374 family)
MNRFLRRFVIAMLFGVAVYGAFLLYTGLSKMQESLSAFRWGSFGLALALASGNYLIRFFRWQYYLGRLGVVGVGALDSLLVFLSGFVLTVTPGKVGEVFKSAVLQKTHGVPMEHTAPIVVAERLTDAVGVIVLIVLGSAAFAGGAIWALAGIVAVSCGLLGIVWQRPVLALFARLEQRGGKLAALVPKLRSAYTNLRVVAGPAALLLPTLLAVVAWSAEGVAMDLILEGFGAHLPLGRVVFFYSTATLAGALVPLPGGLGAVEGMIREQLVHLSHVPEGPATATMMLIRFATLWWAVLVGFAALFALRLRYPEALGASEALAEAATAPTDRQTGR